MNGDKVQVFSLRSGTKQGCPLLPLLFHIVLLKVLVSVIKQEKTVLKSIWIRKEGVKSSVFASDTILYRINQKDSTKSYENLKLNSVKLQGIKSTKINSVSIN